MIMMSGTANLSQLKSHTSIPWIAPHLNLPSEFLKP